MGIPSRSFLMEAALAATLAKDIRLGARYRRVMCHRGHEKAFLAVAHTILVIIYHLHKDQVSIPGAEGHVSLKQQDREQATHRHVKQLERLGHRAVLEPVV